MQTFRKALAVHIAGDQHLMTLSQHGIDNWNDAVWSFVSPAMGFGVYERNWKPLKKAYKKLANNPLKYNGKFLDSFNNKITMHSYANQSGEESISRGLGYSLIRFNKKHRKITFEAYPRFQLINSSNAKQFPGLPKTINQWDNDGRKILGYLPEVVVSGVKKPVLQVINEKSSEILYTLRLKSNRFRPPVYELDTHYSIKLGRTFPNIKKIKKIQVDLKKKKKIRVSLN